MSAQHTCGTVCIACEVRLAALRARVQALEGALRLFIEKADGNMQGSVFDEPLRAARLALNPEGSADR